MICLSRVSFSVDVNLQISHKFFYESMDHVIFWLNKNFMHLNSLFFEAHFALISPHQSFFMKYLIVMISLKVFCISQNPEFKIYFKRIHGQLLFTDLPVLLICKLFCANCTLMCQKLYYTCHIV